MKRAILISVLIVFGFLTDFPGRIENPESDAYGSDTLSTIMPVNDPGNIEGDELVLYLEEVKEITINPDIEQFLNFDKDTESFLNNNTEKKSETEKKHAQPGPIRIETKLKDIEFILRKAVIEPYCISGQIEGLRIKGLDKMFQAKALLLKNDDVIVAVNGQTLTSKKKAYDVFKKARKEPMMTVDLLRDGKTRPLLFDFQG